MSKDTEISRMFPYHVNYDWIWETERNGYSCRMKDSDMLNVQLSFDGASNSFYTVYCHLIEGKGQKGNQK